MRLYKCTLLKIVALLILLILLFKTLDYEKTEAVKKVKSIKSVFYVKDHYKIIFFRKTDLKEMTKH